MKNLRIEKLAQLRGIVKTALGETEVADALKQIRAAKTLQELDALKAKAEADPRRGFLSAAQIASMQTAYDMKKSQLEAASRGATAAPAGTLPPPPPIAGATKEQNMVANTYINRINNAKTMQDATDIVNQAIKNLQIPKDSPQDVAIGKAYDKKIELLNVASTYVIRINEAKTMEEVDLIANESLADKRIKLDSPEYELIYEAQYARQKKAVSPTPQATRRTSGGGGGGGSSDKTAVIKSELCGTTVSDKAYKYVISDDGKSFQWANADKSGVHKQGDSNWGKMVDNLNLIPSTGQKRDTNPAATPATPAATEAPVTPAATGLDQSLVQKVAAVLQKAASNPLNIRSGGDEMDQIKSLVRDIGGVQKLAAVIVSKVGTMLTILSSVKVDEINAARTKDLAVNRGGKFSGDVGIILRQVNELFKSGNQSPGSIAALGRTITQSPATPVTPAATPATPAPEVKTSASLNKKFIKAATLRRMRIRSQMEAAVDSSAQMGRSRVF